MRKEKRSSRFDALLLPPLVCVCGFALGGKKRRGRRKRRRKRSNGLDFQAQHLNCSFRWDASSARRADDLLFSSHTFFRFFLRHLRRPYLVFLASSFPPSPTKQFKKKRSRLLFFLLLLLSQIRLTRPDNLTSHFPPPPPPTQPPTPSSSFPSFFPGHLAPRSKKNASWKKKEKWGRKGEKAGSLPSPQNIYSTGG